MTESDPSAVWERSLPDGRLITLVPMLFGKTRLCVAAYPGAMTYLAGY